MKYDAMTIGEYFAALPPERAEAVSRLWLTVKDNLPPGFEERLSYGMPSFVVPLSAFPAGYRGDPKEPLPFISLANQKNYLAFYHMGMYAKPEIVVWFAREYGALGIGRLDMGKCCIRLKKPETVPYALFGELSRKISMEEWIAAYQTTLQK